MVDRLKDIVNTGGENVSSLRVESVLVQHPALSARVWSVCPIRGERGTHRRVMRKPGTELVSEPDLIAVTPPSTHARSQCSTVGPMTWTAPLRSAGGQVSLRDDRG